MAMPCADVDVVVAPDRHGSGTNAMLVPAAAREFAFGVGSLARHLAIAKAHGKQAQVCSHPALAFDLDTDQDFFEWMHSGAAVPPFLTRRPVPV